MKKLFALLGTAIAVTRRGNPVKEGFSPYADKACNLLYNLSFGDKLELLRKDAGKKPQGVMATLLAKEPSATALQAIAADQTQSSHSQVVAYHRLREIKQNVPEKKLLGVIVEVGISEGLDVLIVYLDGRVRNINPTEKISVFDPAPNTWMPEVRRLLAASQLAIEQIGPWELSRIAPPTEGMIRMNFLVSDGLYFGQGATNIMEQDDRAKPIIAASRELLKLITQESKS